MLRRFSLRWLASGALMLGVTGCAPPPRTAAVAIPPVPAQQARVWFYRDDSPIDQPAATTVRIDGVVVGAAENGSAFYDDVAPGHHRVSVDSYRDDGNQARDADVAPGREVFAKVVPFDNFIEGGAADFTNGYRRPTFYLWLMPADQARPAIAHSWFSGGPQIAAAAPP